VVDTHTQKQAKLNPTPGNSPAPKETASLTQRKSLRYQHAEPVPVPVESYEEPRMVPMTIRYEPLELKLHFKIAGSDTVSTSTVLLKRESTTAMVPAIADADPDN